MKKDIYDEIRNVIKARLTEVSVLSSTLIVSSCELLFISQLAG